MEGIRRKVAALALGAVLGLASLNAGSQSAMTGPHSLSPEQAMELAAVHAHAWRDACAMKKVNCEMLRPPVVSYALLSGAFGLYRIGGNLVLLDIRLIGQDFSIVVMVHEMVHYIQSMQRPLVVDLSPELACADEKEAFTLANEFSQRTGIGRDDSRTTGWTPRLALIYGCPE